MAPWFPRFSSVSVCIFQAGLGFLMRHGLSASLSLPHPPIPPDDRAAPGIFSDERDFHSRSGEIQSSRHRVSNERPAFKPFNITPALPPYRPYHPYHPYPPPLVTNTITFTFIMIRLFPFSTSCSNVRSLSQFFIPLHVAYY
jgi:hypothetical protein